MCCICLNYTQIIFQTKTELILNLNLILHHKMRKQAKTKPKLLPGSPSYNALLNRISVMKLPKIGEVETFRTQILTGIKDVDAIVLSKLNDRELLSFCLVNKEAATLCKDEMFWQNRFRSKFNEKDAGFKPSDVTWKNYYLQVISDLDKVRQAMISQIRADLTIDRREEGLHMYSAEETTAFIQQHSDKLEAAVLDMYRTYRDDDELDDLRKAELDWYSEFLYIHVPYELALQ